MVKKRIMTILGTRPDIIKLSCVIEELDKFTEQILVHTGQNYDYELNRIFFKGLGLRNPDVFLNAAGETPVQTIANVIVESDKAMKKFEPDAVLIYGDTNSALAIISAKRNKIPVFHMEAGNRCFDQRVPEEINRKIVDHLSDINMTLTEHARRYLIAEGLLPETIIKTGSCMKEVLYRQSDAINASNILDELEIKEKAYFVASVHREENTDYAENFSKLIEALNEICNVYNKPVILSTHPRMKKTLQVSGLTLNPLVKMVKPQGFADYIKLQKNAICTISDSGTITEESSILKFPAVTIRQAHERPEGMDVGTLIMCGLDKNDVINAIEIVVSQTNENSNVIETVSDYQVDNVSAKVVRIILSYIHYINRTVWHKNC